MKFFENRDKAPEKAEEPKPAPEPAKPAPADNGVKVLYVEDLTENL